MDATEQQNLLSKQSFDDLYAQQKAWLQKRQIQITENDLRDRIELCDSDRIALADLTRVLRDVVDLERAKNATLNIEGTKLTAKVTLRPQSNEANPVFEGNARLGTCNLALQARISDKSDYINLKITVV